MAKKRNTDFRLGLNRQQLIEGASFLGMNEKQAKKANTQRLEKFIARKITEDEPNEIDTPKLKPKRSKIDIPELNEKQRRDIAESAKAFGIKEGLQMVSTRIRKNTGDINENNFLRLSVGSAMQGFTDEQVTNQDITEVLIRFTGQSKNAIISGLQNDEMYFYQIIEDYFEEKNANKEE